MDQPLVKKGGEEQKENDERDVITANSSSPTPSDTHVAENDTAENKNQITKPSTSNEIIVDTPPTFEITTNTNTSTVPEISLKPSTESSLVATQLLTAHKSYIDELMESLRQEMEVVRDFEALLLNGISENGSGSVGGESITEDDVLRYFETVHGFLDRNTENGKNLKQAMEGVTKADIS